MVSADKLGGNKKNPNNCMGFWFIATSPFNNTDPISILSTLGITTWGSRGIINLSSNISE